MLQLTQLGVPPSCTLDLASKARQAKDKLSVENQEPIFTIKPTKIILLKMNL